MYMYRNLNYASSYLQIGNSNCIFINFCISLVLISFFFHVNKQRITALPYHGVSNLHLTDNENKRKKNLASRFNCWQRSN